MWWKIFFWINAVLAFFGVIGIASQENTLFDILAIVIYIVALLGLYSYVYKNPLLTKDFWKYFFWFCVVYDAAYILYSFAPNDEILKNLAFLAGNTDVSITATLIGTVLDIPILYAIYQLFQPTTKKKK